jgi:hypothetical protein
MPIPAAPTLLGWARLSKAVSTIKKLPTNFGGRRQREIYANNGQFIHTSLLKGDFSIKLGCPNQPSSKGSRFADTSPYVKFTAPLCDVVLGGIDGSATK